MRQANWVSMLFAVMTMQRAKQAGFSLSRAEKKVLHVTLKTIHKTQNEP